MAWCRLQYQEVLSRGCVPQEFCSHGTERRSSRSLNFPITVSRLNQPQLPDITGQRNLCRGNTEGSQFLSELFLSLNSTVPDQTENLSLPVRLVHPIRLSLSSASARAFDTVSGAVPPCTV